MIKVVDGTQAANQLSWRDYSGLSGRPSVITRVLINERGNTEEEVRVKERFEDAMMIFEGGRRDYKQGKQEASRKRKSQGNKFSSRFF